MGYLREHRQVQREVVVGAICDHCGKKLKSVTPAIDGVWDTAQAKVPSKQIGGHFAGSGRTKPIASAVANSLIWHYHLLMK